MALGRFLIDAQDEDSSLYRTVPARHKLHHDPINSITQINLHAPCGLVEISVPTLLAKNGHIQYDSSRLVSFISTIADAIVQSTSLGFHSGLRGASLSALSLATEKLKVLITAKYAWTTQHPTEDALSYLYGTVVVDETLAEHETGVCFFANQ
ncbi:hypothetical protein JCM11251_005164 [Rhodosporidiobolus azoricus]